MVPAKTTFILVLLEMWQVFCGIAGQCTSSEYSTKLMMLREHVFKEMSTSNSYECLVACEDDVRCQSFNYVITENICELSNRTKEARPMDFVSNLIRYYFGRVKNRGEQIQ